MHACHQQAHSVMAVLPAAIPLVSCAANSLMPQKAEGEAEEATEHLSVSQHELEVRYA